jgi:hypothetical protein
LAVRERGVLIFASPPRRRHAPFVTLLLSLSACSPAVMAEPGAWASTVYGARISSEDGWEDVLFKPFSAKYVDAFLVAGSLSREYALLKDGALALEAEGQVVYNFGDQDHWEFNVVPIMARWQRFPWDARVATSAAFGLGLSYATEVPEVEVELEGESHQLWATRAA